MLSPAGTEIDGVIVISDTDVDGRGRPHELRVVDGSRSATLLVKSVTCLSAVPLPAPDHKNGAEVDEESGLMA